MFKTLANFWKNLRGAGYDAAEETRHRQELKWSRKSPRSEDETIGQQDLTIIRQQCMNLARNNGVVAGIRQRFVDNIRVLSMQAKTSSAKWNEEAESFFANWAQVCDARQRATLDDFQGYIVDARMLAGDIGFIILSNGQLQPVEGERIMTPGDYANDANVVMGVRRDSVMGIPVGYYVFSRERNGTIDPGSKNYEYVRREDFIFVGKTHRPDQIRSIPALSPVVNLIRDFVEVQNNTVIKSKLEAATGYIIKSEGGQGVSLPPRGTSNGAGYPREEAWDTGHNVYMKTGESAEPMRLETPNAQFVDYSRHLLRLIGAGLSLPYEFLVMDASTSNFGNNRSALLQTYRTVLDWEVFLANRFLRRVWNWRIAKAIKERDLSPAPIVNGVSEWYKVDPQFPGYDWIDPQSQTQSELLAYQMATTSLTRINRKKGADVYDVLSEKAEELAMADEIAKQVQARTGSVITRAELIAASIPGQKPTADNNQGGQAGDNV